MALDGELWSKRGNFQQIIGTVRTMDNTTKEQEKKWKEIQYMIFDAPHLKTTFMKRLEKLQ